MITKMQILKSLCKEIEETEQELTNKLLKSRRDGHNIFYEDFIKEFPKIEDRSKRAKKELVEFGLDFNSEDEYFTTQTILRILDLVDEGEEDERD